MKTGWTQICFVEDRSENLHWWFTTDPFDERKPSSFVVDKENNTTSFQDSFGHVPGQHNCCQFGLCITCFDPDDCHFFTRASGIEPSYTMDLRSSGSTIRAPTVATPFSKALSVKTNKGGHQVCTLRSEGQTWKEGPAKYHKPPKLQLSSSLQKAWGPNLLHPWPALSDLPKQNPEAKTMCPRRIAASEKDIVRLRLLTSSDMCSSRPCLFATLIVPTWREDRSIEAPRML